MLLLISSLGLRGDTKKGTGNPLSLYGLLQRTCLARPAFRLLKATDSGDKIYGLLGFDPLSDQLGLSLDYKRTTQEAYTAAIRAFVARGEVNVLVWSQCHKIIEGLPSWVPDFSFPLRQPCGENDCVESTEQTYFASGRHRVAILAHESPNVIGVHGVSGDASYLSVSGVPIEIHTLNLLVLGKGRIRH